MKKAKNVVIVLLSLLLTCALIGACTGKEKPVTTLTVSPTSVTVKEGKDTVIVATLKESSETVTWESSNTAVAIVDASGKVTGVKAGTANVKAMAAGLNATCVVTVEATAGVTISKHEAQLDLGKALTLTATPSEQSEAVTWESSNTAVATVVGGVVTTVADGVAAITAKLANGASAACMVRVTDRSNYIAINTPEMLEYIANNMSGKYYLTNDIDYGGRNFNTLGWINGSTSLAFSGVLDGNGYSITNINLGFAPGYADIAGEMYNAGLFREIDESGVVRNLGITDCNITAGSNFGVIADGSFGTIENVYVQASVNMSVGYGSAAGGLVSSNNGTIRNAVIDITGSIAVGDTVKKVGAIAGMNTGDIANCYVYNRDGIVAFNKLIGDDSAVPATCKLVDGLDLADVSAWGMWSKSDSDNPIITKLAAPDASIGLEYSNIEVEDGYALSAKSVFAFVYPFDSEPVYSTTSDLITVTTDDEGKMKVAPKNTSVTAPTTAQAVVKITVDSKEYSAVCTVTVVPAKYEVIVADGSRNVAIAAEGTHTIAATAQLKGATDSAATFTYVSKNTSVATVSASGVVTAIKAGVAEIEVTAVGTGANATRVCRKIGYSNIVVNGTIYDSDFDATKLDKEGGWNRTHLGGAAGFNQATLNVKDIDGKKVLIFDADRGYNHCLLTNNSPSLGNVAAYYLEYEFTNHREFLTNETVEFAFTTENGNVKDNGYSFYVQFESGKVSHGESASRLTTGNVGTYKKISSSSVYKVRVAVSGGKAYFYIAENGGVFTQVGTPITLNQKYINPALAMAMSSTSLQINEIKLVYGEQPLELALSATTATVGVGLTTTINAFFPYLTNDVKVMWTSANAKVTVSENGVVTGVAETTTDETVIITATVTYNDIAYTKTCAVTVESVYTVALSKANGSIDLAKTLDISSFVTVKLGLEVVTDQTVVYECGDPAIATVSDSGVITAVKAGATVITVKTATSTNTVEFAVDVNGVVINETFADDIKELPVGWAQKNRNWVGASTVTVNGEAGNGAYFNNNRWGGTHALYLPDSIDGAKNYYADITYSGFDPYTDASESTGANRYLGVQFAYKDKVRDTTSGNIGKVVGFAVTKGAKTGTEKMFMYSDSGKAILPAYTSDIDKEKTYTVRVMVVGSKAYFYLGETVNGNTEFTLANAGGTTIDAAYAHAGIGIELSSSKVLIKSAVVGVGLPTDIKSNITEETKNVVVGLPTALTAKFSVVAYDSVQWKSSAPEVMTVDNTGVVTAIANGESNITVEYTFNGVTYTSAPCVVTAATQTYLVSDTKSAITMGEGSTRTIVVTAKSGLANSDPQPTITWTSSEPTIASVDANGVVTALAKGNTIITATVANAANEIATTVTVVANEVIDFTKLPAGALTLPDWKVANAANTVGGGGLTVDAKGLIVDTVTHGGNKFIYGTNMGAVEDYYIDYTFSDFICYNSGANEDLTRFIAFKFAFGATDIEKNHYQLGFRKSGADTFYTKYESGIAKADLSKGTIAAFSGDKTYTIRAAVVKTSETVKEVRFFIAEVDGGVTGAFTPIKIKGTEVVQTFDAVKYPNCGVGIEANSSKLNVQKIEINIGRVPTI